MLKFLTLVLPLLLKGPTKGPVKDLIGRSVFSVVAFLGFFFLLAAFFVWLATTYTLVIAFLVMSILFFSLALMMKIKQHVATSRKAKKAQPKSLEQDTLANLLPDSLTKDPAVQQVLDQVSKNPIPATAIAVLVGAVIAREIFKKD